MMLAVSKWLGITPITPDDELDRLIYLEEVLENYGFHGGYSNAIRWHELYEQHGRYPFGAGGYDEQPVWVFDDLRTVGMLIEQRDLRKKYAEKKPSG